ncbi:hypothetical protein GCM10028895_50360 [Pontibacter rugosus]
MVCDQAPAIGRERSLDNIQYGEGEQDYPKAQIENIHIMRVATLVSSDKRMPGARVLSTEQGRKQEVLQAHKHTP